MKSIFVLNFEDALVYDESGLLTSAYHWPFGRTPSQESVQAMGAMIDAQDPSLVPLDIMTFDFSLHHRSLWNSKCSETVH